MLIEITIKNTEAAILILAIFKLYSLTKAEFFQFNFFSLMGSKYLRHFLFKLFKLFLVN